MNYSNTNLILFIPTKDSDDEGNWDCFTDCITPYPDTNSDPSENQGNSNSSDDYIESEHIVEAFTENINEWKRYVSEFKECIQCTMDVTEYPRNSDNIFDDDNQIFHDVGAQKYRHVKCETVVKLLDGINNLPSETAAISLFQFTKMNESSMLYESDGNLFDEKRKFNTSDLDYGETDLDGFVVDSLKPGQRIYDITSADTLNIHRSHIFSDAPSTVLIKGIKKMSRNQEFYSFVCALISGKQYPIKFWKWGFQFNYDREAAFESPKITVEETKGDVIFDKFKNLYRICHLPTANDRYHFTITQDFWGM